MANKKIQEQEVIAFLNSWKEGIIAIGKEYLDHKDYKAPAEEFISSHYGFDEGEVLFKPTLTKDVVFRNNAADALSYFIKGHIDEDGGFAIRPWKKIDLLDSYIIIENSYSFVMGILHFIPCFLMYSAVPLVAHSLKFNLINSLAKSIPSSL